VFKFLLSMHFMTGVLVPFFISWGKISYFQIMVLQSFFAISVFLLEVPTGAIADYISRKFSLILAALATTAATLIYASFPNFYVFILAEFFWALGVALASGADQALIYDSLKKIKKEHTSKKVLSRYQSFNVAGFTLAAPIGSIIAVRLGLEYTFRLAAIPMFLAVIIGFTLTEPKTKNKKESRRYVQTLINGVKYFKQHRIIKILAFDQVSISVLAFFIIWTYQPILQKLNLSIAYLGWILAGMSGAEILIMNNATRLEKLFRSKKNYLLWSALITGTGFLLLGFIHNVIITVFIILSVAGFGLSRRILFDNYLHKFIESKSRATVLSTISMFERFSRAIMYLVVGLIVTYSLEIAMIFLGVLIIIFSLISRVEESHLMD
jgi:MFS family permease